LSSCSKLLEQKPYDGVDSEMAFNEPNDVRLATIGVYSALRSTSFQGKNFIAVSEFVSDIATKKYVNPSNGWFDSFENMSINESSGEISAMWNQMYVTIDRCARAVEGAKKLLNGSVNEADTKMIQSCISQCYAVKALSLFDLTLVYALPYNESTAASTYGVPNIGDKPVTVDDEITRANLSENYSQILSDIESAKSYAALAGSYDFLSSKWIYMNEAAIYALEARVNLYMKHWDAAKTAAETAISKRGGSLYATADSYSAIWSSLTPSDEDIFTLTVTTSESSGASSIGNLFGPAGSYGGRLTQTAYDKFETGDMRLSICEKDVVTAKPATCYRPVKYNGDNKGAVSNVPVFRLPEMYLIIAEAELELGHEEATQIALFNTAKRNPAYVSVADLPSQHDDLKNFIKDERIRELMIEGHRLWDMRRTGELLSKTTAISLITYSNWDVSKFAFPIPQRELNVTGLPQNDWTINLPVIEQ
jgi:hypothetical protein